MRQMRFLFLKRKCLFKLRGSLLLMLPPDNLTFSQTLCSLYLYNSILYLLCSSRVLSDAQKKQGKAVHDHCVLDDFWLVADLLWQKQCVTHQGLLLSQLVIRQLAVSLKDSSSLTLTFSSLNIHEKDDFRKSFLFYLNIQITLRLIWHPNLKLLEHWPWASWFIKTL